MDCFQICTMSTAIKSGDLLTEQKHPFLFILHSRCIVEAQGLFGSFIPIIPYNITNVNGNGANGILQGTLILNSTKIFRKDFNCPERGKEFI